MAQLDGELAEAQQRVDQQIGALAGGAMAADEIRPRLVAEKARKTPPVGELPRGWPREPRDSTLPEARAVDVVGLPAGDQTGKVPRTGLHYTIEREPFG